jgi:hypothetical protein
MEAGMNDETRAWLIVAAVLVLIAAYICACHITGFPLF